MESWLVRHSLRGHAALTDHIPPTFPGDTTVSPMVRTTLVQDGGNGDRVREDFDNMPDRPLRIYRGEVASEEESVPVRKGYRLVIRLNS